MLESTLVSDPAPARPSLAVGLFGRSAGEHAREPAQCADHIPLGPGREAVPVGFSGQSRPNPIHGSIVGRPDYFSATTGLLPSYSGRVLKIARRGGARPPTAGGNPAGPRAALDYFPITREQRRRGSPNCGRSGGRRRRSKIAGGRNRHMDAASRVETAASSRNWGWLYRNEPLLLPPAIAADMHLVIDRPILAHSSGALGQR